MTDDQMKRVWHLISALELSLWHPIMENTGIIFSSQLKMQEKRGGNLCAPVPGPDGIGTCSYINDGLETEKLLESWLQKYKTALEQEFDVGPEIDGVEVHCSEVGLEDPRDHGNSGGKKKEEATFVPSS